jgi:YD repeat-containing protein
MKTASRFFLFLLVLFFIFPCSIVEAGTELGVSSSTEEKSRMPFSWNLRKHEAPFVRQPNSEFTDFAGPLVFANGDFSFPLGQTLVFESSCNCYSLMVSKRGIKGLELITFWRARAGFYRSAKTPYLELENADSLTSVTALNGTRFLFAEVGDGEWRCVSIHDAQGNYLLLDYRADGLISRIRDSLSRTAIPGYSEGQMISLTQTWVMASGADGKTIQFLK